MYKLAYSETVVDAPEHSRATERDAVDRSIELMHNAQAAGMNSREALIALNYLRSLWSIMIEDLAKPENGLPPILRAQLISIGISILRQIEDIRVGRQTDFVALIDISTLILEGLK
jgi:flagellar biosynthesis activator protein FlaF